MTNTQQNVTPQQKIEFGQRLKELREQADLTQNDLARRLGVEKQHISRWECGKNLPGIDSLIRLSAVLGLSVSDILSGLLSSKTTFVAVDEIRLPQDFVQDLDVLVKDRNGRDLFHELLRRYKSDSGALHQVLQSLLLLADQEPSSLDNPSEGSRLVASPG